jgi:putative transposase
VARRKRGSHRQRKAVALLAKTHQTVRRQRRDFHHKTALALVKANDTIYHENLQGANMVKNHHLAKSISDAGWGAFLIILADKAAYAGRRIVAVNPAYSSQQCSGCGGHGLEGLIRSLALVPGVWNKPASGPQRRQEQRTGLGGPPQGGMALAASEN